MATNNALQPSELELDNYVCSFKASASTNGTAGGAIIEASWQVYMHWADCGTDTGAGCNPPGPWGR